MGLGREALHVHEKDNVAVALCALKAGTIVKVSTRGGAEVTVRLSDDVPFGHKFALRDIQQGESVIKYGEVIGVATRPIRQGQHVHTQNVDSLRGRGDKR